MEGSQIPSLVSYNIVVNHFTYPQAVTTQCIVVIITLNSYPLIQFRLRKIILFYFYFFLFLAFFPLCKSEFPGTLFTLLNLWYFVLALLGN